MGRATRMAVPDDVEEVHAALRAAGERLAALRTLGIRAPELAAKVAEGEAALVAGDLGAAQARADEVRIVVKLAATEIERLLNHGELEPSLAAPSPAPRSAAGPGSRDTAPEADLPEAVQAVVEDAFGKALYSKALRQMVEIVAAERLREFLADPDTVGPLLEQVVRRQLREALQAQPD